LCFSVGKGVRKPPSLYNIFRELRDDLGYPIPYSGDLTRWADNGVLLLNATLTVRSNEPRSHHGHGWEQFTSAAIAKLSSMRENLVFMLWGRDAQEKEHLIDEDKHLVLRAAHPSPYAAEKGFFGSRPFSECNEYLLECGLEPIDWNLEPDREF
jgi:uracil-DNA glycosylase